MSDDLLDLDVTTDRPLAVPSELPILPLRDTVLFPNSFMPLAVAREASVRLIDDAMSGAKLIGVFTQRDASIEEPTINDLYTVGTLSHVHKMFKLPDGSLRLIVQGLSRLTLDEITASRPYLRGRVSPAPESLDEGQRLEIDALLRNIKTSFQQVVSLSPLLSDDLQTLAANITEPGRLSDFIASSLTTITTTVKQEVLEKLDVRERMDALNRILIKELEVLELGSKIQSQVQSEVGRNQREGLSARAAQGDSERARGGRRPDQGHRGAAGEDRCGRDARGRPQGSAAGIGSPGAGCRSPQRDTPSRAPTWIGW